MNPVQKFFFIVSVLAMLLALYQLFSVWVAGSILNIVNKDLTGKLTKEDYLKAKKILKIIKYSRSSDAVTLKYLTALQEKLANEND